MTIKSIELSEVKTTEIDISDNTVNKAKSFSVLDDVNVSIEAKIGNAMINVNQLFSLKKGDVVELVQLVTDPVELFLNGNKIGAGELVASNEKFGIRIVEIAING